MFHAHQPSFKFTVYSSLCNLNEMIYLYFIVLILPLLLFFSSDFSYSHQVFLECGSVKYLLLFHYMILVTSSLYDAINLESNTLDYYITEFYI